MADRAFGKNGQSEICLAVLFLAPLFFCCKRQHVRRSASGYKTPQQFPKFAFFF